MWARAQGEGLLLSRSRGAYTFPNENKGLRMSAMSPGDMKALAALISQFLKDRNCEEQVVMLLVHDLQEKDETYTGTMSYMSTVPPDAAAHMMEFQAANLRAGKRGETIMVHTTRTPESHEQN